MNNQAAKLAILYRLASYFEEKEQKSVLRTERITSVKALKVQQETLRRYEIAASRATALLIAVTHGKKAFQGDSFVAQYDWSRRAKKKQEGLARYQARKAREQRLKNLIFFV